MLWKRLQSKRSFIKLKLTVTFVYSERFFYLCEFSYLKSYYFALFSVKFK